MRASHHLEHKRPVVGIPDEDRAELTARRDGFDDDAKFAGQQRDGSSDSFFARFHSHTIAAPGRGLEHSPVGDHDHEPAGGADVLRVDLDEKRSGEAVHMYGLRRRRPPVAPRDDPAVEVTLGGRTFTAERGSFVLMPKDVLHMFRVTSAARMLDHLAGRVRAVLEGEVRSPTYARSLVAGFRDAHHERMEKAEQQRR